MRCVVVVASLLVVALAGCADSSPKDPTSEATTSSTGPEFVFMPPVVPKTDTLHLREAGTMSTLAPGQADAAIIVPLHFTDDVQQPSTTWSYELKAPARTRSIEVSVPLRVGSPGAHFGFTPVTCTYNVFLTVHHSGSQEYFYRTCDQAAAGPVSGEFVLTTSFGFTQEVEFKAGWTIEVAVVAGILTADDSVAVVTGAADHDATVRIDGMREPIGPVA